MCPIFWVSPGAAVSIHMKRVMTWVVALTPPLLCSAYIYQFLLVAAANPEVPPVPAWFAGFGALAIVASWGALGILFLRGDQ